jgi:hypothetical protein
LGHSPFGVAPLTIFGRQNVFSLNNYGDYLLSNLDAGHIKTAAVGSRARPPSKYIVFSYSNRA